MRSGLASEGGAVTIARAVALAPFGAEAEGIGARWPVHGEDAVEVVDFVLNELGHVAAEIGAMLATAEVQVLQRNVVRANDTDHELWERKAVVPNLEVVGTDVDDLRIDKGHAVFGELDEHDADRGTDLRCGQGPAHVMLLFGPSERVAEIVGHEAHRGAQGVGDGGATSPENRVAE